MNDPESEKKEITSNSIGIQNDKEELNAFVKTKEEPLVEEHSDKLMSSTQFIIQRLHIV